MEKIISYLETKLNPKYMNDVFTWHQIKKVIMENNLDLIPIKIDGLLFLVKPIINFSQLKRLAGGDNDYYSIECINKPKTWEGKEIGENEYIDLNHPDCVNLEFRCVRKK